MAPMKTMKKAMKAMKKVTRRRGSMKTMKKAMKVTQRRVSVKAMKKVLATQWQPGYAGENYYIGACGQWWRKKNDYWWQC